MHEVKFIPETDEWIFRIKAEWFQKDLGFTICKACNGKGTRYSGFGSMYEEDDKDDRCKGCWGSGKFPIYAKTPKPSIPEDLTEHMREAYNEWLKKHNKTRRYLKLP